jgi:hypothetical protein
LRNDSISVRRTAAPRAADVSPPWVRETHLQERCRKDAEDCRRYAHERRCSRSSEPTGGLRPPLLLQCERLSAKKRFLRSTNARSQERRASARRGAGNASAMGNVFQRGFRRRRTLAPHGRLTPTAPDARCPFAVKSRITVRSRTRTKSGGRQPAVGASNAVAIADAFVQKPASTRRGCGNAVATVFAYRRPAGRLCATNAS